MLNNIFSRLFSYQYLFGEVIPLYVTKTDRRIFYFGVGLVVLAIILFFVRRMQKDRLRKNLLQRWISLAFWIGLLLAFWYELRYELIQVFSAHIVAILIFLAGLVWAGFILRYQFKEYPELQKMEERQQLKNKYI